MTVGSGGAVEAPPGPHCWPCGPPGKGSRLNTNHKEEVVKTRTLILAVGACAALLLAGTPGWTQDAPFWFWRWGHMEGPHDSSKTLGISDDGKTAVGATVVVDFQRAWRSDIDWAIATDDQVPPLFNELKVQEDIGIIAPSQPSAAYASSNMLYVPSYDLTNLQLDWGGSMPVGTIMGGTVSYGIEWLLPVLDSVDEGDFVKIPDFGGGTSLMEMTDVSADGLIVVGYGSNRKGPIAFRADMIDPLLPVVKTLTITDSLYTLQTLKWSVAEAMAVDSTLREFIAGYGGTKTGNRAFVTEVLDPATDPITLQSVVLPLLGGGKWSEAYAMAVNPVDDHLIVAGRSDSSKGPQACIWWFDSTSGLWVVKGLGGLSKKTFDSVATGVVWRPGSDAGELLVVGRSKSILYPSEAMIWAGNPVVEDDGVGYIYDLEYIMIKTGTAEVSLCGSEWILNEATGVALNSSDPYETRIVGWGTNPEGGIEAYVVTGFPYMVPVFTHE